MRHISTTPFGRRPVTAGLLAQHALAEAPARLDPADKWAVLQDLTEARAAFGLTDRNLAVLSALLSFHPDRKLVDGPLTVFPSNASLGARLHGMPESTLRRHLAALVDAGIVLRHDSPNGKRYAMRDGRGQIDRVFGFDLRPLLLRADEIAAAAEAARETARQIRHARQTVILLMRDLTKILDMADAAADIADNHRARLAALQPMLRRKLDAEALSRLAGGLRSLRDEILAALPNTPEMGGNDSQNERHHHNTNPESFESEPAQTTPETETLPLEIVLKAAPEIQDYSPDPIRHWHQLDALASFVHPMLGITSETWRQAGQHLGAQNRAIALACILQRADRIRSPGAYLRRLATGGDFQPGPMVLALLRSDQMARG